VFKTAPDFMWLKVHLVYFAALRFTSLHILGEGGSPRDSCV
jgi:hypothetical protein